MRVVPIIPVEVKPPPKTAEDYVRMFDGMQINHDTLYRAQAELQKLEAMDYSINHRDLERERCKAVINRVISEVRGLLAQPRCPCCGR